MATRDLSSARASSLDAARGPSAAGTNYAELLERRAEGDIADVVLHGHLDHIAARAQLAAVDRAAPLDLDEAWSLDLLDELPRAPVAGAVDDDHGLAHLVCGEADRQARVAAGAPRGQAALAGAELQAAHERRREVAGGSAHRHRARPRICRTRGR